MSHADDEGLELSLLLFTSSIQHCERGRGTKRVNTATTELESASSHGPERVTNAPQVDA